MTLIQTLKNVATGASVGAAVIVTLPFFGAIGTATATGLAVGSLIGAAAGAYDSYNQK